MQQSLLKEKGLGMSDFNHIKRELDEIDIWAESFGRWDEFSRANNLSKDRRSNYVPKCYKCRGIGEIVDKKTYRTETCRKCGGKGWSNPRPKFLDHEIRKIVQILGEQRVKELIYLYNKRRGNI